METICRFFQDPETSFFLFGPRGTGKSTWLRQNLPEAVLVDLLRPEAERCEQFLRGLRPGRLPLP